MAVLSYLTNQNLNQNTLTGITLILDPYSSGFGLELQRTVALVINGLPDTTQWQTIAVIPSQHIVEGGTSYTDLLPANGQLYWYQFRSVQAGYTSSPWVSGSTSLAADVIGRGSAPSPRQATARFAAQTVDQFGYGVSPTVQKNNGMGINAAFVTQVQQGTCQHNVPVVFGTAYQSTPLVVVWGGLSWQPASLWTGSLNGTTGSGAYSNTSGMYQLYGASAASTGFTPFGMLRQAGGSPTAHTDLITASLNVRLSSAPSSNGQYVVSGGVTFTGVGSGMFNQCNGTITIYYNINDDSSGVYTTLYSNSVAQTFVGSGGTNYTTQLSYTLTDNALITGDHIEYVITNVTLNFTHGSATYVFTGYGALYNTETSTFTLMTPSPGDTLDWIAFGVV